MIVHIISFYITRSWFVLSKRIYILAFEAMDDNSKVKALEYACHNGLINLMERCLKNLKIDLSGNTAIVDASWSGHVGIVKRLLQDSRFDPSFEFCWSIRLASLRGHVEVVDCLLQDSRIDPSALDNCAIRWAAERGHAEVVERLLQDSRVDPASQNNYAVGYAAKKGYTDVVEILLRDPRVQLRDTTSRTERFW
jgi:hypothetical protein